MSSHFKLKTYQAGSTPANQGFFIQSRGYHSGRPLKEPIANCYRLQPTGATSAETLYWLTYCLYKSQAFHPYLIGSVIPFLRLDECRKVIARALVTVQRNPQSLTKTIALISDLEKKRTHLLEVATHLDSLHEAILLRLLNPDPA